MRKSTMFIRMLISSFQLRKSRMLIALFAIIVGTAVISGLLSVYYDINIKMGMEFRSYGANLILTPTPESQNKVFPESTTQEIAGIFPQQDVVGYTSNLYGLVTINSRRLVVVGTWFDQISKITPYWEVTGTMDTDRNASGTVLVGKDLAEKLGYKIGTVLPLKDEVSGNEQKVTVTGTISSGGTEDNQIFINLAEAQKLFHQEGQANAAYFSITGEGLDAAASAVNLNYPQMKLSPIKQISGSETVMLDKISSLVYIVVIIILLSTLLCVATTMMTMVMERKQEIALKKVLGAQNKALSLEFLSEAGVLALAGTLVGLVFGYFLAQVIGESVFHSSISFRWAVIPLVTVTALLVAGLASLIPLRSVIGIEPAVVLKGE
ncbi:FtsX-like permease family protein [Paenibacillus sp. LMG 31459]|uniref:FtsX-like permease family protein n=1 Tax=Paenibacillus phytohabitans TaxID=2654978 RepID=A0ABX1YPH9_9BACL|nr:ABC transporter permease [Paenibacillus phytohabitans]NOU82194.1 FtsX-like permease family protein [Paenibacillus phytohabitans]